MKRLRLTDFDLYFDEGKPVGTDTLCREAAWRLTAAERNKVNGLSHGRTSVPVTLARLGSGEERDQLQLLLGWDWSEMHSWMSSSTSKYADQPLSLVIEKINRAAEVLGILED